MNNTNILTISFATRVLDETSREHARMVEYATKLGEFHIVVLTNRQDGYSSKVTKGNLTIYPTNSRTRLGKLCTAIVLVRSILTKHKTDWIVSSQDPFATSLIAQVARIGTKANHHIQVHGDVLNPRASGTGIMGTLRRLYARYVLRRADCIRVVSKRIAASLRVVGVPRQKITILPIQADIDAFLKVGSRRQYERIGAFRLLYVGRFAEEKNLPLMCTAIANARTGGADITLTCVGDGPLRASLEKLQSELALQDVLTFVSWSNNIPALMEEADALLLASEHEGWGMVIVEAMAAGLPVITTDVGCAGEMLEHQKQGLIVPVGDTEAFATAVTTLAADRKQAAEYGQAGYQKASLATLSQADYISQWVASFTCGKG